MTDTPEDLSVSIVLHAVDPARLDQETLAAGVTAAVIATRDPELRIVVSGSFEEYVRDNDDVLAELPAYVQTRVTGQAVGRVLTLTDGSRELLVDASVVDVAQTDKDHAERVFAHEALHLVIDRRNESTYGRRARLGYELGSAAGAFAGMAGQLGEEYRVERALRESGRPIEETYREELGAIADEYAATLKEPFWAYQRDRGMAALGDLMEPAMKGFEEMATVVAYLIGDDVGAGQRRPPAPVSSVPNRWFERGYQLLYEPLAELPSASTPCPLETLDELLEPVADALRTWLADVGFHWTGGPAEHHIRLTDPERLAAQLGRTSHR